MRPIGEIFRRGMESAIANWPLILIRVAEAMAMIVLAVAVIVLAVVPVVLAGGLVAASQDPEAIVESLAAAPLLVLYLAVVVTLLMGVLVLLHSFVMGGVMHVYVEAERRAPDAGFTRASYAAFTPDLWWQGAKRFAWRFFWIYNLTWGLYSLLLLVPLVPIALLAVLSGETGAAVAVTCLGIALVTLFAVVLALPVWIWSQLALLASVRDDLGAIRSLKAAWPLLRQHPGAYALVFVVFLAISMTVGGVAAGFSIGLDFAGQSEAFGLALLPIQVMLSLVQSVLSALLGAWMLASLAAVAVPGRTRHVVQTR